MPRDLRDDTTLTGDPERPGRFHAHIPDAWKVVYIFGGVSMYAALRAMQEALGRADLSLVTANAIFLSPVPAGPIQAGMPGANVAIEFDKLASSTRRLNPGGT